MRTCLDLKSNYLSKLVGQSGGKAICFVHLCVNPEFGLLFLFIDSLFSVLLISVPAFVVSFRLLSSVYSIIFLLLELDS